MIKYKIETVRNFSVCGMRVEITKYQDSNFPICRKLCVNFNSVLYKYGWYKLGNWKNYALTYKQNKKLNYFCSIPEQFKIQKQFFVKQISRCTYLVCKHIGDMSTIKDTVNQIYTEFLLKHKFDLKQDNFVHFKTYDKLFNKYFSDSIIHIYIPVEKESVHEEMDLDDETKYI